MRNTFLLIVAVSFIGCASKQLCADESDEPVSTCRAERACGKGSFGLGLGLVLSGMGSGMSHQQNQAQQNYNQCVQNNLEAQKYNSQAERSPAQKAPARIKSATCQDLCFAKDSNGEFQKNETLEDCLQMMCSGSGKGSP